MRKETVGTKTLLNVKEMCSYLGIGQTKARELLSNPDNGFTVRIGNRLYAHKAKLDKWLLNHSLIEKVNSSVKLNSSMQTKFHFLGDFLCVSRIYHMY